MSNASILSGAQDFLVESVSIARRHLRNVIVIGGWCPFLRNDESKSGVAHPGTKDVDLLCSDADIESGKVRDLIGEYLDAGFMLSAKHEFQLLKPVRIGHREFVYNLDLLYPSQSQENSAKLIDLFDTGVPERVAGPPRAVMSIVLPSSTILFERMSWQARTVLSSSSETVDVPLLSWSGLILSKCESVKQKKRPRDAFDIWLAIQNAEVEVVHTLRDWSNHPGIFLQLRTLRDHLLDERGAQAFDANVAKYAGSVRVETPHKSILSALERATKS